MNLTANLKRRLTLEQAKDTTGDTLLGGFMYLAIPSLLKLRDWPAWWTAVGVPVVVGAALDRPGIMTGAIMAGTIHLGYSHLRTDLEELLGVKLWNFTGVELVPGGLNDYLPYGDVYGLHEAYNGALYDNGAGTPMGNSLVTMANGQQIMAATPTDIPASGGGIQDYLDPDTGLMDEYEDDGEDEYEDSEMDIEELFEMM